MESTTKSIVKHVSYNFMTNPSGTCSTIRAVFIAGKYLESILKNKKMACHSNPTWIFKQFSNAYLNITDEFLLLGTLVDLCAKIWTSTLDLFENSKVGYKFGSKEIQYPTGKDSWKFEEVD